MSLKTPLSRRFLPGVAGFLAFAMVAGPLDAREKEKAKNAPDPALLPVEDVAGLTRVLLVGESISIGYTLAVSGKLEGKADVHRPRANCGPTTAGMEKLDAWLATGGEGKKWDVIQFNRGPHDSEYLGPNGENLAEPGSPGSHRRVSSEDYRKNLETPVAKVRATSAKLIWRNTSPVPAGAKGRVPADVLVYNEIAKDVMARAKIPTHDLYDHAFERLDRIQKPADSHFTPEGSAILADDVVRVILETLQP
jgi:hypothetical protein